MARLSTVRLTAPPAGGALFGVLRGLPFLADAVSYALSTGALLLMRTRFQQERDPEARVDLREGLAYFWQMPFQRTTAGMVAASNIAATGVPVAVIILARRDGLSSAQTGLLVALEGVTLLAGSLLSPLLRRVLPMRVILLSEFWWALVYVAFVVDPNVYVLAITLAVHAFWFPNTDSAMNAYCYTLIPDRMLGRGWHPDRPGGPAGAVRRWTAADQHLATYGRSLPRRTCRGRGSGRHNPSLPPRPPKSGA